MRTRRSVKRGESEERESVERGKRGAWSVESEEDEDHGGEPPAAPNDGGEPPAAPNDGGEPPAAPNDEEDS